MGSATDFLQEAARSLADSIPLLPMEVLLLVSALAPIYTGAYASLSRPSSAAKPKKDLKVEDKDDEEEDEEETIQMEGLTPRDAIVFPLTAGLVLGGLYWAIKAYGADFINLILGWYFTLIGVFSVSKLASDTWAVVESFIAPTYYRDSGKIWKLNQKERKVVALDDSNSVRHSPLPAFLGRLRLSPFLNDRLWADRGMVKDKYTFKGYLKHTFDFNLVLTQHNVISTMIGSYAVLYSHLVAKPWWLTNIQGFAVCYGALQLLSPTSFGTGSLILFGLFCYDIWAVFFTPLMVTVAKNLDVPIKMVFPRPDQPSSTPGAPPIKTYSMLGLGDIVLPGIMIALALRFDLYLFYLKKQTKAMKTTPEDHDGDDSEVIKAPYVIATGYWGDKFHLRGATSPGLPQHLTTSFPKTYFTASMVGYIVGMLATLIAMAVSHHAQPALLYLVPGVLISLLGTGLVRGELDDMLKFNEAITGEALDDGKSEPGKGDGVSAEKSEGDSTWDWLWNVLFDQSSGPDKSKTPGKDGDHNDSTAKSSANGTISRKTDSSVVMSGKSTVDPDSILSLSIIRHHKSGSHVTPPTRADKELVPPPASK